MVLAIGSSAGQAEELATSLRAEGARFAAITQVDGQGVRAVVSNVLAPAQLAPCKVQVSFFGADGSLIGQATKVELRAGESTSLSASNPSKLVRAVASIGDVADPARMCALRTNLEMFDVRTNSTLASVPGESIGREETWASSLLRGTVARKRIRSPIVAAPPPTAAR